MSVKSAPLKAPCTKPKAIIAPKWIASCLPAVKPFAKFAVAPLSASLICIRSNEGAQLMFLKDVENQEGDGSYNERIAQMQELGFPVPQIWHLFAFKPRMT